jgi:hypothetical protein
MPVAVAADRRFGRAFLCTIPVDAVPRSQTVQASFVREDVSVTHVTSWLSG